MHSDDDPSVRVRPMVPADRSAVADIIMLAGNFNPAEIECALELVDIYLTQKSQTDYRILVAEDAEARVHAYACWGPVPLTKGAYDLYWIATRPEARGRGYGSALMAEVESRARGLGGRLLAVETSSKPSYEGTVRFYRRLGYEQVSRIRDFYDVGDDKLILVKRLS